MLLRMFKRVYFQTHFHVTQSIPFLSWGGFKCSRLEVVFSLVVV